MDKFDCLFFKTGYFQFRIQEHALTVAGEDFVECDEVRNRTAEFVKRAITYVEVTDHSIVAQDSFVIGCPANVEFKAVRSLVDGAIKRCE